MPSSTKLQLRHGTATEWSNANTVLLVGEVGVESNTGLFKLGDGSTAWNALTYAAITTGQGDSRWILQSTKGQANGVATLDGSGKIPSSQLGSLRIATVTTVADQAARLALPVDDDAQFVVQSSNAVAYMLAGGADPSVNANWIALPQPSTAGLQATSEKGQANGYAPLGSDARLPAANLPGVIDGGTP